MSTVTMLRSMRAEERISVETAARELRYGFFRHLLGERSTADPQGLKPDSWVPDGTAEAVPFPNSKAAALPNPNTLSGQDRHRPHARRSGRNRAHAHDSRGGAARAGRHSSANFRGRRRWRMFPARLSGRCSGFAGANWNSISRTSANPGAKTRPMWMRGSRAIAFASWSSRCWSRNSIPRWRKILRIGGDCARRRRLLGERNFGLDGDHGPLVAAGLGPRMAW